MLPVKEARVPEAVSPESMQAGFDAQKKAIVLLRNAGNNAARLPINNWRYSDVAGGTAGAPDLNEFTSDTDKDGQVEVFLQSFDGDHLLVYDIVEDHVQQKIGPARDVAKVEANGVIEAARK